MRFVSEITPGTAYTNNSKNRIEKQLTKRWAKSLDKVLQIAYYNGDYVNVIRKGGRHGKQ